ncbi:MAG: hypothetical protein D3909_05030 [Candidatus Electrothrix sp. ATG1]|nr:hypothetical protein [Candidatus Electrothrix sp. ATG1]MCI5208876.1 hypothetical protein [Candidatus Electrothrix sp. ATG2]
MVTDYRSKEKSSYWSLAIPVFIIINIRVEAGLATPLEQALDGLIAISVLALMIHTGLKFFNVIEYQDNKNLLP